MLVLVLVLVLVLGAKRLWHNIIMLERRACLLLFSHDRLFGTIMSYEDEHENDYGR